MSAGDYLKGAWDATESAVQSGMDAASAAIGHVEDAAVATGQAILTGVKAAVVLSQAPTYVAAQVAALIYTKVSQAFSSEPVSGAVASCSLSNQQRLANSLAGDENLLAKAAQRGLQNNPNVVALQKAATAKAQALMSDDVYNDTGAIQIPGYQRMTNAQIDQLMGPGASSAFISSSPNFHAALYASQSSPPQYTLAFRGTDPSQMNDVATDLNNALGLQTGAYSNAIRLANSVDRAVARVPGATMEVTGHSLGGGLAQAASAETGAQGNIFNAAGYDPDTFPQTSGADTEQDLTNYHVAGEPLTTLQNSVVGVPAASAQQVSIPGPANASLLGLHSMDSVESGMTSTASGPESAVRQLVSGP
jgi:hypothetical protein